jgi:hypothetical protein
LIYAVRLARLSTCEERANTKRDDSNEAQSQKNYRRVRLTVIGAVIRLRHITENCWCPAALMLASFAYSPVVPIKLAKHAGQLKSLDENVLTGLRA